MENPQISADCYWVQMIDLYKTKGYTRPELGRVLSRAGQYAHVPIRLLLKEIDNHIDISHPTIQGEHILNYFDEKFKKLCPVCLTLLEEDFYYESYFNTRHLLCYFVSKYSPTFIKCNQKTTIGHKECLIIDRFMFDLGNLEKPLLSNIDIYYHFFKSHEFKKHLKWISKRKILNLRFNPRLNKRYNRFKHKKYHIPYDIENINNIEYVLRKNGKLQKEN